MSYIGAGTSIIGGELQGWAALLDKWAMQDAYQKEAQLQNQYRQQAVGFAGVGGVVPGAIQQSSADSAKQMMQQGATSRNAAYNTVGKVPLGGGFNAMSRYDAGKQGADAAYTNMLGGARANLGSYSDWAFQQAINNLRNQQTLNQISSFAGGQARNVFPLQMYQAQHSNDALAAIGQAISSIGGAAGNYAQLYGQQPPQQQAPTYTPFQGFSSAYGTYYPTGYNTLGSGYEGTYVPG